MIRIARTPLPVEVAGRLAALTERLSAVPRGTRSAHARRLWRTNPDRRTLRTTLAEMAPGRQHCMYCGDNQGTDIDHHEPLSRNPLRTFDWLNHLLACSTCNSHEKRDRFPVDSAGAPLLIDPTVEDPFEHLLLTLSLGAYHPLTAKGRATIEVCGLNRPLLTRGRVQAQRVVILCLREWSRARDAATRARAVLTVREQPFADVCQSMLRQAALPTAELVFSDSPGVVELLRTPELRSALLS
ncbi:HNH endonuclease [Allokutzneria oryzae]|uniref:HNH endonuclease n=1 Tax=Allokutzneria oryzae TaxID=1378989 RepID=A0ABV5ZSZ7_9PSEU